MKSAPASKGAVAEKPAEGKPARAKSAAPAKAPTPAKPEKAAKAAPKRPAKASAPAKTDKPEASAAKPNPAGRRKLRSEERRVGKECVSTCRSRLPRVN